jgi:MFS family permease
MDGAPGPAPLTVGAGRSPAAGVLRAHPLRFPFDSLREGWPFIAAAWAVFFLGLTVVWHATGIFLVQWERTFGWGRGLIAGAFSLGGALSALATLLVGQLTDRYRVYHLLVAGTLVMGVGLVLLAFIQAPWHLYAAYTLSYTGFALMGHVPMGATLARAFRRGQALAIGIAHTGMGSGGIILAPLIPLLIATIGWRWTLVVAGALTTGVLLLLGALVFRRVPVGREPPVGASGGRGGATLRDALGTPEFWALALAFVSANFALSGVGAHLVPFLADRGVSLQRGSLAIVLQALSHVGGKLSLALLAERFPPRYPLAVAYGVGGIAVVLLVSVSAPWTGYLAAGCIGLAMSATTVFQPVLAARSFGTAALGSILGVLFALTYSLASAGGGVAGLLYDLTGTYRVPFLLCLLLLVKGSLLVLVSGRGRRG